MPERTGRPETGSTSGRERDGRHRRGRCRRPGGPHAGAVDRGRKRIYTAARPGACHGPDRSTGSTGTETKLTHNVLDEAATTALLAELSTQIHRAVEPGARLILVGIHRRGDSIAAEIGRQLEAERGSVPIGSLDITLYRDDFGQVGSLPLVGTTEIPEAIDDAHIVIVDDVLHTGRTIRAALNELSDFGRARKIELCVLVDRGGRQLPIQPDYVGQVVDVASGQGVAVRVADLDGGWGIDLIDVGGEDPEAEE